MEQESTVAHEISRKEQAEQTKEKLLSISLKLVREQGYDQVKIADICAQAGVSTGAFYHHLKSKAGILSGVYARCDAYFEDVVYPLLKGRCDMQGLLEYVDYQMVYCIDLGYPLCAQIYRAQLMEQTDFVLSQKRGLPAGLIGMIGNLQKDEVLSTEKSAEEIGEELLLICRGIVYYWCQKHGQCDIKKLGREIVNRYLRSYAL